MPKTAERPKATDSEKITVNLGYVDLGRIDLLVREGFYTNRSDFIRNAIRKQLDAQAEAVTNSVRRNTLDLGIRYVTCAELERLQEAGETLDIKVLGLVRIAPDVTPQLALATIASITVLGALQVKPAVRAALAGRIT